MSDRDTRRPLASDYSAAMQRAAQHLADTTPALPTMDVAESIELALTTPGTCIDDVARVVWAARDLVASWDAARILGFASSDGAMVPVVLARIESLRAALAGRAS
jgi:hypothetical protein